MGVTNREGMGQEHVENTKSEQKQSSGKIDSCFRSVTFTRETKYRFVFIPRMNHYKQYLSIIFWISENNRCLFMVLVVETILRRNEEGLGENKQQFISFDSIKLISSRSRDIVLPWKRRFSFQSN